MYILYNVCMPSGAEFVKTVVVAALTASGLSVETQRFVKGHRDVMIFNLL